MAEQLQGGEEKSFYETFMDTNGCTFQGGTERLPAEVRAILQPYFDVQHDWASSTRMAEQAERRFIDIVGQPSSVDLPEDPSTRFGRPIRMPGTHTQKKTTVTGYGRTLAGIAAYEAEEKLYKKAATLAEEISDDMTLEPIQKVLLNATLQPIYPKNPATKDVVEYYVEAANLLEEAQTHEGQPLLMVRRRQREGRYLHGNMKPGSILDYSDIISAESFDLQVAANGLHLVLSNARQVRFERYGSVSWGGRPGMLGSAEHEHVWHADTASTVQSHDIFDVGNVLGSTEINSKPSTSFSLLRQITSPNQDTFVQSLPFNTYVDSGFSGQGDASSKEEAGYSVYVGNNIDILLDELPAQLDALDNRYSKFFFGGLKGAVTKLQQDRDVRERNALMQQISELDIDPIDFYS